MTNREMLMELKKTTPLLKHIKKVAKKIISKTCDSDIEGVNYIVVTETDVFVGYNYTYKGECDSTETTIPIEWFDEEFDYVKEYEKMLHEEEARLKHVAIFNRMYMQLFASEKKNHTK